MLNYPLANFPRTDFDQIRPKQKCTWIPQTVHNTPVMNILKVYCYIILFKRNALKKPKSNFKFQSNLSMHVGGKCRKWMDGWKAWRTQIDTMKLDLYSFNKVLWKISAEFVNARRRKCGRLCSSIILSPKRGITPTEINANWRNSNLICSTVKLSHMQNYSSICQCMYETNVENLQSSTLSFKRGITPIKLKQIDGTLT